MGNGVKTARMGLVAGVTVGGAVLSFTCAADTVPLPQPSIAEPPSPIAQRIERLRQKIAVAVPTFIVDAKAEKTDKLVQFFNFFNCVRGMWKNC